MPTNPAAPVTRTEKPLGARTRAEFLTRFSQAGPPHEKVRRERRVVSADVDEGEEVEGDDLKKNMRIRPRKTQDQNVSFARGVECHLKRW